MKTNPIQHFVIYSRKSRFTGKGESIENQIDMCRQYIAAHFGREAADAALIYEDEGFSGGTLDRPQFKRMMNDSQSVSFAAIVVYRLDRISRNIGDFAKLIEELGNREIGFISIREQFDTTTPMGRAMMYIASVFSQLERETIAERIRDNMHELAKTGRWLGGNTPTGYESESISHVTVDGKTHRACMLKMIPDEIRLVQTIFDKFIETGSLTQTDQYLLQGGYKTKRGKSFTRFAIKGILSNPVYVIADEDAYRYLTERGVDLFAAREDFDGQHGVMAYNRTLQRPGKSNREKPMNEWIVSVGKHHGVVSGATWIRAQSLLDLNRSKSYRKPRSHVALLSGLLYCAHCGDYMRPKLTNRVTATGEPVFTYLCTTKERSCGHTCTMKNVGGNALDARVIDAIREQGHGHEGWLKSLPECLLSCMADQLLKIKKELRGDADGCNDEMSRLRSLLEESEGEMKPFILALGKASGTGAEPYILAQIDELHQKRESLQKRLSALETASEHYALTETEFEEMSRRYASPFVGLNDDTVEEKRAAIRSLVKRIVWDGENIHLYLRLQDGDCALPAPPHRDNGVPSGEYRE